MSSAAFYAKFMRDMAFEQRERGGGVPHVVPSFGMQGSPACAWADAGSIIPWTVYQFFGDTALLREQYDNMKLWVEWIHRVDHETGDHRLWQAGFHFADWLALDAAFPASCTGGTDPDFIASAFYLYSTRLTRQGRPPSWATRPTLHATPPWSRRFLPPSAKPTAPLRAG